MEQGISLVANCRKGVRGPISTWPSDNVTVITASQSQLPGVSHLVLLVQILWDEISLVFCHNGGAALT